MSGILYVVATPIGNLEDVTLRALRILREVTVIAAEDTRRTANLLARHGIATPTTSLHEHNEVKKTPALLARLQAGDSIAVVSDAGTPGLSDPGLRLAAAAVAEGLPVVPIPGPSAVTTALAGSGLPFERFTFAGFPPNRSVARKRWLFELASAAWPVVIFEAPHRIRQTLADARIILGERQIVAGREMTKAHEEWLRGSISEVLARLESPRGEFTVVIAPASGQDARSEAEVEPAQVFSEFCQLIEKTGCSRRAAIADLARTYSIPAREVYKMIEDQK
jgi:16S rRNA (cytidine1402-2'-O)-methyltransferase